MEKRITGDHECQLPRKDLQNETLSGKRAWLIQLINSLLRPFRKQGRRKRKLKYKRTEVTKDKYIHQEFLYREE